MKYRNPCCRLGSTLRQQSDWFREVRLVSGPIAYIGIILSYSTSCESASAVVLKPLPASTASNTILLLELELIRCVLGHLNS